MDCLILLVLWEYYVATLSDDYIEIRGVSRDNLKWSGILIQCELEDSAKWQCPHLIMYKVLSSNFPLNSM